MALKYLSNIDLNGNQLRGASIEPLSSAPSDHLVAGRVYFDTSENVLYSHTGSAWVQVGTTYTTSIVSDSGIKLRLTGNDSTSDDILFAGGTGLTTVRTDASTITLNLDDTAVTRRNLWFSNCNTRNSCRCTRKNNRGNK